MHKEELQKLEAETSGVSHALDLPAAASASRQARAKSAAPCAPMASQPMLHAPPAVSMRFTVPGLTTTYSAFVHFTVCCARCLHAWLSMQCIVASARLANPYDLCHTCVLPNTLHCSRIAWPDMVCVSDEFVDSQHACYYTYTWHTWYDLEPAGRAAIATAPLPTAQPASPNRPIVHHPTHPRVGLPRRHRVHRHIRRRVRLPSLRRVHRPDYRPARRRSRPPVRRRVRHQPRRPRLSLQAS